MKKTIALLIIFACMGTVLSAQVSVGAGGLFFFFFKKSIYTAGARDYNDRNYINFGGFAFLDATFIELNLGARYGLDNYNDAKATILGYNATYLFFGAMGKFPINITPLFTFFPLVGAEYDLAIYRKDNSSGKNVFGGTASFTDYSRLWIKGGVGADVNLTKSIYIRPSALYSYGINNAKDKKDVQSYSMVKGIMHHGFDLRLGAGFKF